VTTRSLAALGIALAVLAVHAAPAGARERADEVAAGSLRARTTGDPWRLVFLDRSGAAVLRVLPRGGLRFLGANGWVRATRVLQSRRSRRAHLATLATDDPLGRRLALRIEPDGEGVIALRVEVTGRAAGQATRLGIGFRARGGERYLGFGERSNAVDQPGREVENYVAEGAFEPDERALVPLFVPDWGFRPRDDATYFPMPWLLSSAGYGVLVDNPQTSRFDLGTDSPRTWSVDVDGPALRLRVFAGPRPAAVLRRLSESRGRRVLLAWPRGRSAARLEEGGVARSRETRGAWALSLRSRRRTRWTIEASLGTLRRPFQPCSVQPDGGRLAGWRYDRRARVLRMRFTARRGRVVARGC
jgi:galactose mutarotase-like protein